MKNILVLGGSGFVGRHVCEALNRAGVHITVPTRRLPARSVQMLPMVSVVQADVHDPAQLPALLPGHDAVINLIAILHGTQAQFDKAHVQLPALLAKACLAAGVNRLVHISALGADVNAPSMYQRSKAHGEQVLQEHVPQGLALTVLRPSVIFGEDDAFINVFAKLQALAPVVPLAGAHTRSRYCTSCGVFSDAPSHSGSQLRTRRTTNLYLAAVGRTRGHMGATPALGHSFAKRVGLCASLGDGTPARPHLDEPRQRGFHASR